MKLKACRSCKRLVYGDLCPDCKSSSLSEDWQGLVIVLNPEKSVIAEKLKIKKPGRYVLTVR